MSLFHLPAKDNDALKRLPILLDLLKLASRYRRIARGSGQMRQEVKEMLKNYKNSKGVMKASKGRQMQGLLRKMGLS